MSGRGVSWSKEAFEKGKNREDEGEVPFRYSNDTKERPVRDFTLSVDAIRTKQIRAKEDKKGGLINLEPWQAQQHKLHWEYEAEREDRIERIEKLKVFSRKRHVSIMQDYKFHLDTLQGKSREDAVKRKKFNEDDCRSEAYVVELMLKKTRKYMEDKELEGTKAHKAMIDENFDWGETDPFA